MTSIIFHSNQLGARGTEVAMFDYAYYAKYNLGIRPYIAYNLNKSSETLAKFQEHFQIVPYDNFDQINNFIDKNKIDWLYAIKGGKKDGIIANNAKTFVHTVFQRVEPHGDKYVFISEWLAKYMGYNNDLDYLPFMVVLPSESASYRDELGIPKDAIVLGRHGGASEFNIPFVHEEIKITLEKNSNLYFVFLNTDVFYTHPRIKYIPVSTDRHIIRKFINTCDMMIHARLNGESFGLAIAEFLYCNKPVITFYGGMDLAHLDMCKDQGIYYRSPKELASIFTMLKELKDHYTKNTFLPNLVYSYTPSMVINKFERILNA